MGSARQTQGTAYLSLFRGVSVWHIHWEVWTKCRGYCFLSVSHSRRHLLHAFVGQVAVLVLKAFAHSINDTINFAKCKFRVRARRERCYKTTEFRSIVFVFHLYWDLLIWHRSCYPGILLLSECSKISSDCSPPVKQYCFTFIPSYLLSSCQSYVSSQAAAFFLDKVSFREQNSNRHQLLVNWDCMRRRSEYYVWGRTVDIGLT